MTREEAKEELIQALTDNHIPDPEAVEMAIKALEQEPCTDTISRQAVLDLAKFDGRDGLGSIIHAFDVERLPPVTPAEKVGHWRHYENMLSCPECGAEYYDEIMYYCGDDVPKYCPSCGCKMTASPTGEEVEE